MVITQLSDHLIWRRRQKKTHASKLKSNHIHMKNKICKKICRIMFLQLFTYLGISVSRMINTTSFFLAELNKIFDKPCYFKYCRSLQYMNGHFTREHHLLTLLKKKSYRMSALTMPIRHRYCEPSFIRKNSISRFIGVKLVRGD